MYYINVVGLHDRTSRSLGHIQQKTAEILSLESNVGQYNELTNKLIRNENKPEMCGRGKESSCLSLTDELETVTAQHSE